MWRADTKLDQSNSSYMFFAPAHNHPSVSVENQRETKYDIVSIHPLSSLNFIFTLFDLSI